MIPKIIHYCWFGTEAPGPLQQRCLESWRVTLPGFTLKRWDASNSQLGSRYAQACMRDQRWSRLANLVRLQALFNEGGVYLDTDVEVLKDLTPLLSDPCFLGFQQREAHAEWVNTAVVGSVAGHAFVRMCMDRILETFEHTGRIDRSPVTATAVLSRLGLSDYGYQKIGGVTLYPVDYFYPYSWLEDSSDARLTSNTYCIHHWAASWKKGLVLEMPRPLRRLRRRLANWARNLLGGGNH